jgi:hypothetical protein
VPETAPIVLGAASHTDAPNIIFHQKQYKEKIEQVSNIEFELHTCPTIIKRRKFRGATSGHPIAVDVRLPKNHASLTCRDYQRVMIGGGTSMTSGSSITGGSSIIGGCCIGL